MAGTAGLAGDACVDDAACVDDVDGAADVAGGDVEGDVFAVGEEAVAGVNDGLLIPSAGIGAGLADLVTSVSGSTAASIFASSFAVAPFASARGVVCVRDAPAPVDPERELPDLVRDDDMEPLSMTAPLSSASGSESRNCGAVMNGDCVFDPASSTPSSSVPNGAPLCLR